MKTLDDRQKPITFSTDLFQFRVFMCVLFTKDGGTRKKREHTIRYARESKPEGSRTKVQRRKPPSAKAPKSEGCWSSSKLDCYLHRMRACILRTSALTFQGLSPWSSFVTRIKDPGYIMPHDPSSARIVPGIPYALLIIDWLDELRRTRVYFPERWDTSCIDERLNIIP